MAIGATRIGADVTTLTGLMNAVDNVDGGKHLRLEENGVGLHTSGKVGGAVQNLLSKLGNDWAKTNQKTEREGAVALLKQKIDNEYGRGTADAVFRQLNTEGRDLSKGVKVRDLEDIKQRSENYARNWQVPDDEDVDNSMVDENIDIAPEKNKGDLTTSDVHNMRSYQVMLEEFRNGDIQTFDPYASGRKLMDTGYDMHVNLILKHKEVDKLGENFQQEMSKRPTNAEKFDYALQVVTERQVVLKKGENESNEFSVNKLTQIRADLIHEIDTVSGIFYNLAQERLTRN